MYTFGYAQGGSYMTNDPTACANCHVMREHYESWMKGSHRKAAVCNDCHTPPGLIPKYYTKALNGFNHSLAFTTGHYSDHIQITKRNSEVTQQACLKCHEEISTGIRATRGHSEKLDCITCHSQVGHQNTGY